ncbi:unnamed protein product [Paramecium primaurelia]|uniref:Uncharacterized protein n=1 Tax=Paramecium primaurelia TaxID=5886 RepID=A0A8S1LVT2_PARPR|nr:unnamed protein product [Paramecium primaurelia]
MFCASIALFGTIFLGFLGYLVQIQMPFLKFKMLDRQTTQNALYTSSIIYFVLFLVILLYDCFKTKPYPQYKVYQQWKYEIY